MIDYCLEAPKRDPIDRVLISPVEIVTIPYMTKSQRGSGG